MPEPEPKPLPDLFTREWWKRFLALNAPQFIVWALAVLFALLKWAWTGEKQPLPEPPIPVFEFVVSEEIDAASLAELEKRSVKVRRTGWREPTPEETADAMKLMKAPRWQDTEASDAVTGPEDDAPLWRLQEKVTGQPLVGDDQGQIGSCVSFGGAKAVELSLAAKIYGKRGPPQAFSPNVREALYGGSRINCDPRNPMRGGDGSTGARLAKWLQKGIGGALPLGNNGPYSVKRCREWGDRGVPADLVKVCQDHPCQTTLVTSADQGRQAIQQGYAIFVCSSVGFGQSGPYTRDADGFLKASGQWMHCMCIAGYQGGSRKGFLIINSWGANWVQGPTGKFADIPPGSFWADYATVDRMLKQGDSYAVADVEGFKKRKINPSDWVVRRERPGLDLFALAP